MDKKNGLFRLAGICFIAAVILSSCSAAPTTVAPVTQETSPSPLDQAVSRTEVATNAIAATDTAVPTATATLAPSAETIQAPAATAVGTETATLAAQGAAQVVPNLNPYCRKGPGWGYHAITYLLMGTAYAVVGRDKLNSWWLVQAPGNVNCWVDGTSVARQGPVEQVSVVQGQPLPGTPAQFANTSVCDSVLKKLGVSLNWAAAVNITGYNIYRNGDLLTSPAASQTSYPDDAPLGVIWCTNWRVSMTTEWERVSTSVQACE